MLSKAARLLRSLNPALPDTDPKDPEGLLGHWYITPERHVVEFLSVNSILLCLGWVLWQRWLPPYNLEGTGSSGSKGVCLVLLLMSYLSNMKIKLERGIGCYLCMPCAIFHVLLILVCILPFAQAQVLFDGIVQYWGLPVMALITPDYRDYKSAWEIAINFFLLHILLVVVPLYFAISSQFSLQVEAPVTRFMFSYVLSMITFMGIMTPVGIMSGFNLNFMMAPPRGFEVFGKNYRLACMVICGLIPQLLSRALFESLYWYF